MSNDQNYTVRNDAGKVVGSVFIAGGANVTDNRLFSPKVAHTLVDDDQMKILDSCSMFRRHKDRGVITVSKSKADPEKISSDMTKKDNSAQATASDFKEAPKTN